MSKKPSILVVSSKDVHRINEPKAGNTADIVKNATQLAIANHEPTITFSTVSHVLCQIKLWERLASDTRLQIFP